MSNKVKLKKCLIKTAIAAFCVLIAFSALNFCEYRVYTKNYNRKLAAVVSLLREKYGEISENELIEILNSEQIGDPSPLERYGIFIETDSVIAENDRAHRLFSAAGAALLLIGVAVILLIFMRYEKAGAEDIADITRTVERINRRSFELDIDSISEDELSILKNEIYKTAVTLREAADNSNADKLNLKKSLEDISHQLKTPLTSILVMLENLIDDPDIKPSVRDDFIRSIKRETMNIDFFIQAILKLSRFDSNTIRFKKEKTELRSLVADAVQNVDALCDLRNITVVIDGEIDAEIVCDRKWQTEAVANILKNCVDHSFEGGKVIIRFSQNNVYAMIEITDFGEGISKKDLPHVFERFYKGENATPESIGIGLALSKSIIEEDSGTVSVDSSANGTTFKIKYFTL